MSTFTTARGSFAALRREASFSADRARSLVSDAGITFSNDELVRVFERLFPPGVPIHERHRGIVVRRAIGSRLCSVRLAREVYVHAEYSDRRGDFHLRVVTPASRDREAAIDEAILLIGGAGLAAFAVSFLSWGALALVPLYYLVWFHDSDNPAVVIRPTD